MQAIIDRCKSMCHRTERQGLCVFVHSPNVGFSLTVRFKNHFKGCKLFFLLQRHFEHVQTLIATRKMVCDNFLKP